jgi:hypothetical protein
MATTPTKCPDCGGPIRNGVCVRCGYRVGKPAPGKRPPTKKPPAKKGR